MAKKKVRVSADSAPSCSFPLGEEARARFKHQSLLQDYQELIKETEEKKEKFQMAMERKLKLLAEVKFLRKKYESLSNTAARALPPRVKKRSLKILSPSVRVTQPRCPPIKTDTPLKQRNKNKEVSGPNSRALLDLNQNVEEIKAFEVEWEPLKIDNLARFSTEQDAVANDLRLSICRDVGSGSNPAGKRKISWQDQLALRNVEEIKAFEVEWEPLKIDNLARFSTEQDAVANDLRLSICRDVGSGSNPAGKRKISWQDQLALRV
ncbi:hypothetical protein AXF42_Ash010902 [Apostasia shenzhenica]|uniref:Uncharacterized protein n=1 Tax=Apostasia shenzhenica TaxID=1088818 RepID=A0A2I0A0Z8_9ASPA|nr:hypothetical protein AXF42_Ash010902 [Apostasia shenzhenica]